MIDISFYPQRSNLDIRLYHYRTWSNGRRGKRDNESRNVSSRGYFTIGINLEVT